MVTMDVINYELTVVDDSALRGRRRLAMVAIRCEINLDDANAMQGIRGLRGPLQVDLRQCAEQPHAKPAAPGEPGGDIPQTTEGPTW